MIYLRNMSFSCTLEFTYFNFAVIFRRNIIFDSLMWPVFIEIGFISIKDMLKPMQAKYQ